MNKKLASAVLQFAGTPLGERVAERVSTVNRLLHNDSGDIERNGERWLLRELSRLGPATVFDIGANQGDWTKAALRALPGAQFHLFEPVPTTFARLENALAGTSRVILNQRAVSSTGAETLRMWSSGDDGLMSSATAPPRAESRELLVSSVSGDAYVEQMGLDHIDLLKIDVEGHEMQVLDGFAGAFRMRKIDVVQFEFTLWAVIAKHWLADYYSFFGDHGFAVGKLLPRRIAWKDYQPEDEQFLRCNFVAALRGTQAAAALGVSALRTS